VLWSAQSAAKSIEGAIQGTSKASVAIREARSAAEVIRKASKGDVVEKVMVLEMQLDLAQEQIKTSKKLCEVAKLEISNQVVKIQELNGAIEAQTTQLNMAVENFEKEHKIAEAKAKEAKQNGKERDVVLYSFALVCGAFLLKLVQPFKLLAGPYALAVDIFSPVLGSVGGYWMGRGILKTLANVI
jgi:hypothetical protein